MATFDERDKLIEKKSYEGGYPSSARSLIEAGVCNAPRQMEIHRLSWAEGLDIIYTLKNMTPANFEKYSDQLLLLALQESERYKEYKWRFAGFNVKLGKVQKGKDIPEIVTFQAAMHWDSAVMVYGEQELGYEVPQQYFLINKVKDILDIVNRYKEGVNKQNPYVVISLFISVREPRFKRTVEGGFRPGMGPDATV